MSSAGTNGTNGTDVGTTLTTQGDILYRDGSGLQRFQRYSRSSITNECGATASRIGQIWWNLHMVLQSDNTAK